MEVIARGDAVVVGIHGPGLNGIPEDFETVGQVSIRCAMVWLSVGGPTLKEGMGQVRERLWVALAIVAVSGGISWGLAKAISQPGQQAYVSATQTEESVSKKFGPFQSSMNSDAKAIAPAMRPACAGAVGLPDLHNQLQIERANFCLLAVQAEFNLGNAVFTSRGVTDSLHNISLSIKSANESLFWALFALLFTLLVAVAFEVAHIVDRGRRERAERKPRPSSVPGPPAVGWISPGGIRIVGVLPDLWV